MTTSLLSLLIATPIIGGVLVLANGDRDTKTAFQGALLFNLLSLFLCGILFMHFLPHQISNQFIEYHQWIPLLNAHYALGIDGISFALIVLTVFITLVVILAAKRMVEMQLSKYLGAFLLLQGLMVGVFSTTDALLFYVFWEAMLIPMYLIIGIWGSDQRAYASMKFFLYTFLGSALMLVALLYLHHRTNSFALADFYQVKLSMHEQLLLFSGMFLAFAVKIPMWPVHTWLPDAHTEAPAGGSVILAAIMLKMGGYGFLRFILPILPDACLLLTNAMIILSLVAVVYIGFVAIVQQDIKRLIAYSSIAHMGIVTLGFFLAFRIVKQPISHLALGMDGAMLQMISHAFSSGALFIAVGMLYQRMHTRMLQDFGGVVNSMPILASFVLFFAMANVGLPGTSGFVGEFMVILASFQANIWVAFLAATTLILSAAYTLWMYKRVFFGKVVNASVGKLHDIDVSEKTVLLLLAFPILIIGLYPQGTLNFFHGSIEHVLQLSLMSKL